MVQPPNRRAHGDESGSNEIPVTPNASITPSPSSQTPRNGQMVLAYTLPKPTLSQRLGYEIINLVVGSDPNVEPFAVHKNILRDLGGFFAKMCTDSPSGARVILKAEDPQVFKLLIDYAYTGEIPYVSVRTSNHEKAKELRHLVQFYALADKFNLNLEVRDKTMDNIQEGFYIIGKLPEAPLIQTVYNHSGSDSKLRKFCAASMVYQLHDDNYLYDGVIPGLVSANVNLMADFLEAVRDYRHREDPRIRHCRDDPRCAECDGTNHLYGKDGVHPCRFHMHHKTKTEDGKLDFGPCHLWKSV